MKTFCTQNGCSIDYQEVRPRFCPHCGSSMLGNSSASLPPPARRPQYQQTQNWEDEVEQNDFDIDPSMIRVNIAGGAPKPVLADHIVGTGSTGFGSRPKITMKDYKAIEKKMHTDRPGPIEI